VTTTGAGATSYIGVQEALMSRPGSTHAKREREQQRNERAKAKEQRREEKKNREPTTTDSSGGDPDLAGIVPGPQPPREEWQ
jgi:hypothetical protein